MASIQISSEWQCASVERKPAMPFWAMLAQIRAKSGRSLIGLLAEIIALRLGKGRLSFDEYVGLRLYDDTLYAGADKKAFVGFKSLQKIWLKANYRFDFFGLVNNKITTDILLGTYGFPVMPTIAIFREKVGRPSAFLLRDEEELRHFLARREHYPLFCKPISGHQSLGSASLDHYDPAHHRLITTQGYGIPFDTFIDYVKAYSDAGYIFQRRVSPHAEVRKLCGDRLATVRLLTIMTKGEPKLLRACWKIPAGPNSADNFWRDGNLLAELDLASGRVLRAVRARKPEFEEISRHPDTAVGIAGFTVPNWQAITQIATEGARVMEEMALVGWDIAPIDSGAVIVEVNETPDFKLHQLADRRGMLDEEFMRFLTERKRHAADWLQKARQKQRVFTELVPPAAPDNAMREMPAPTQRSGSA